VADRVRAPVLAAENGMAVKLRLKRLGRRHRSFYRLTAMDARRPRDGRILEELGTYDPQHKDAKEQLKLNADRIKHWLELGAVPTDTVATLLKKQGITAR
jgi:small subunit ribosomal protein S16